MRKTIKIMVALFMVIAVAGVYSFGLQDMNIYAADETKATDVQTEPAGDADGEASSDAETPDDDETPGASDAKNSLQDGEETGGDEEQDGQSADGTEADVTAAGTEGDGTETNTDTDTKTEEDDVVDMDGAVQMENCDFLVKGEEGTYSFDETTGVLTITGDVIVAMKEGFPADESTGQRIVVADDCKVTLNGVRINAADKSGPGILIQAENNVNLVLAKGSENNVTGAHGNDINATAGGFAGIEVEFIFEDSETPANKMASLTISGSGKLNVTGGPNAAGIGGSNSAGGSRGNGLYGNITINGGTINATGPGGGAGIGSSNNPGGGTSHGSYKATGNNKWGAIKINGGTINAVSTNSGAGIGGGNHVDSGKILITGGTVTADGAAGIGCGIGSSKNSGSGGDKGPGYYAADIEITGGTITATSNDIGAAIGGGMYCDAIINISGGTINATGGSRQGNPHHGGAGIGGGYLGHADIDISGGEITAIGGDGAAGIGSGGSPNSNPDRGINGRGGTDITTVDYTDITISGGTIEAKGGVKGGAGIGLGVGADKGAVTITGGDIRAEGAKSERFNEDVTKMAGGAGIGSGFSGHGTEDPKYFVDADIDVTIEGGNILAIGGWGASGIGSGAQNTMANSVEISVPDSGGSSLEAYADGTKFAIDTRILHDDGTTTSCDTNRDVSEGYILQGTFVHNYKGEGDAPDQSPEGLHSIVIGNDGTGEKKELTGMPAGYRSYAANVSEAGIYTVYTDAEEIGEGGGRYFSQLTTDKYDKEEAEELGKLVQYTVEGGKISDNFYLFPVKSVVVEKKATGYGGTSVAGLNATAYFGVCYKDEEGNIVFLKNGDDIWAQTIEIKNGVPQAKAYFVNLDDRKYDVREIKSATNTDSPIGSKFGSLILKRITTQHGDIFGLDEGAKHGLKIETSTEGDQLTITVEIIDPEQDTTLTLSLFADGKLIDDSSRRLDKDTGWKATWTVPVKDAEGNVIEYKLGDTSNNATIDENQWSDEVTVINTYEGEKRQLVIKKTLTEFVDHKNGTLQNVNATFVFRITGKYDDGTKDYDNVVSMDFTMTGDNTQEVTVTGLPGDITDLKVEEIESGNYMLDPDAGEPEITEEDGVFKIAFTNIMSDIDYKGGVTNHYLITDGISKFATSRGPASEDAQ